MSRYDREVNQAQINAILRRLIDDEDGKITFKEFSQSITPVVAGYQPEGCLTPAPHLGLPDNRIESDDILAQSKHLGLLRHDGVAFNLEMKK